MNNRNQQTARVPAPAEATALTYLNVFTVEEYENNGKTQKRVLVAHDRHCVNGSGKVELTRLMTTA